MTKTEDTRLAARLSARGQKRVAVLGAPEASAADRARLVGQLEALEHALAPMSGKRQFRLCDYFDAFCGAGSAGAVALALAHGASAAACAALIERPEEGLRAALDGQIQRSAAVLWAPGATGLHLHRLIGAELEQIGDVCAAAVAAGQDQAAADAVADPSLLAVAALCATSDGPRLETGDDRLLLVRLDPARAPRGAAQAARDAAALLAGAFTAGPGGLGRPNGFGAPPLFAVSSIAGPELLGMTAEAARAAARAHALDALTPGPEPRRLDRRLLPVRFDPPWFPPPGSDPPGPLRLAALAQVFARRES